MEVTQADISKLSKAVGYIQRKENGCRMNYIEFATRYEANIFYHNSVRPDVSRPIKNYSENSEVLLRTPLGHTLPLLTADAERPQKNTVHIRTEYQKCSLFILGCQAGTVLFE